MSRRSTLLHRLTAAALPLVLAACGGGGGGGPEFAPKSVRYEGRTLVVDGVAYSQNAADFVGVPGTVWVFSTPQAADQARLTRFVESFGLTTGEYRIKGRQPPFDGSVAPVAVPVGFESQWAQALRQTPPGASALTLDPCC